MDQKSQREIFAIAGLPPEVLAVAFAKYSRSPLTVKEIIADLTEEKSAEFHEKWVLGYGDASVADMAVVAIAMENVSILASKAVQDARLASFQEKSTRYQVFDTSRFYRPSWIDNEAGKVYGDTIARLMSAYEHTVMLMKDYYRKKYPKPQDMDDKMFEAKLKARACDVARYILPVATLTNFGMIMSARELRYLIAKLRGSNTPEIRAIAGELEHAAVSPAYNPQAERFQHEANKDGALSDMQLHTVAQFFNLQLKGAPTLVKHTEARDYLMKKTSILQQLHKEYVGDCIPSPSPRADFIEDLGSPEQELVTTLFYGVSTLPYRFILQKVKEMSSADLRRVIAEVNAHRTPFDQLVREFEVPGSIVFDTLYDYGAFRDLQRHRMMTQIHQPLSTAHGYEVPQDLEDADGLDGYKEAMDFALEGYRMVAEEQPDEAAYLIPMAFKKRTLLKMNLREFYHLVELRSKTGGHFSYRELVYEMYEKVKAAHPLLVNDLRAVKMNFDEDFFKR